MTKLVKIASTKDMLQLDFGDGKNPTWAHCPSAVKSFASQNIKLGDAVDIVSEQKSDGLHVTSISKAGNGAIQPPQQPPVQGSPSGGGSSGTYTSSSSETTVQQPKETGHYKSVSPDTQKLIVHQSVMASACQLVSASTGQAPIQPEGLADYAIVIYRKLLAVVEEK